MINKIIKICSLSFLVIIILLMSISAVIFKDPLLPFSFGKYLLAYKIGNYEINKEDTKKEEEYREVNIKTANEWTYDYFGPIVSDVVSCEYIGKRRGWHPDSEFVVHIPFCEDKKIFVESGTRKVFTRDFEISTDPKFQHLYSEWVKRQVGIDDENVELKFYGQQSNPKMYISFENVKNLNNNYDEIFENVHNFYCCEINIKHLTDLNENNILNIASEIKDKYFDRIKNTLGIPPFKFDCRIGLSNNEFYDNDFNRYYRCDYDGSNHLIETPW